MYEEILRSITAEDRRQLAAYGVPASRVSEWIHARRLPTRPQAIALAAVKGVDASDLERELTLIECERDGTPTLLEKAKQVCILC